MAKAVKAAPKDERILNFASEVEIAAGRFDDALAHAQTAIAVNDKPGPHYLNAAVASFGTRDVEGARKYLKKVLEGGEQVKGLMTTARQIEGMLVKRSYTLTFDLDPKNGLQESGSYRVAIPRDDLPYMTVSYKVTGAKSQKLVKGEANNTLLLTPQGKDNMKLTMDITVEPYSYKEKLAKRKDGTLPAEVKQYLGAAEFIDPSNTAVVAAVKDLKGKDSYETASNIAVWMKKNVEYQEGGGTKSLDKLDFKTADQLLERKSAECMGYSVLYVAMCRAAGVPARTVWGIYMKPDGSGFASHNWAEVYIGNVGWVPIDPQLPESLGLLPNSHIRTFMGMRKNSKGNEMVPQYNLVSMGGERTRFEVKPSYLVEPSQK
jgi:transglutaminase-like putative cysteine protease